MSVKTIRDRKRPISAREAAERLGVSERTVRNLAATRREDWLREQFEERERIRVYKYDEGHTWEQTANHWNVTVGAVKQRAWRARRERAAEREEAERRTTIGEPLF